MAEGRGFEPPIPCGMLAFQASALDHYATPPWEDGNGGEHSGIERLSQEVGIFPVFGFCSTRKRRYARLEGDYLCRTLSV